MRTPGVRWGLTRVVPEDYSVLGWGSVLQAMWLRALGDVSGTVVPSKEDPCWWSVGPLIEGVLVMDKSEVLGRVHRIAHSERFRLRMLLGRTPTMDEVHESVRESCISWCESWFSDAEKALPEEAQRALALQWLDETGVLGIIAEAEEEDVFPVASLA